MSYSTQLYSMQQKTRVVVYQTDDGVWATYRYETVYAKRLTVNKGCDNVLLFEIVNQEEKPVNVTGSTFMFRMINTEGDRLLFEKPMVILNAQYGRIKVTLSRTETTLLEAQPASYSITQLSGVLDQAVFTDSQCGARAPIQIVDSIQPEFVPSTPLSIPTTALTNQSTLSGTSFQDFPGWANPYYGGMSYYAQGYISGADTEYYSSFIEPSSSITTIQLDLIGYTGTIKTQWAENYQSMWYNVDETDMYLNHTGTIYRTVVGWYPLLRLCFNNSLFATLNPPAIPATGFANCVNGQLTSITLQNPGSGYMAPPLINIIGNGSGAAASATIDPVTGAITTVTIDNPGSGYLPIPMSAANPAQANPIPAVNSGAIVVFGTGYATNIFYR